MTHRTYLDTDNCNMFSIITNTFESSDGTVIILDQTIFHPKGGGQPADVGYIGDARVLNVISQGDAIWHMVSKPVRLGEVQLLVDEEVRSSHAKLHSAGHLIGNAGIKLGWIPRKAHHWPGECRITFKYKDAIVNETKEMKMALRSIQAMVDAYVDMDMQRSTYYLDDLRHVGFGDLDTFPCGGTHVISTGMIGTITIKSVALKKDEILVKYE